VNYVINPGPPGCVPVHGSGFLFPVHRIYCVGRNYADHAREMGGSPERETPFFFSKPADAVVSKPVVQFPRMTAELHHEVELVVAIGSGGNDVPPADTLPLVFGYAVGVDLTRRDLQSAAKKLRRPWDVAKGFDQSAPISAIVPASVCGHPQNGAISLSVNGNERQRGDLVQMIWSVPEILAELSRYYELLAGDLVFTGTPAGVGKLEVGDLVECSIEGIGSLAFTMNAQQLVHR
jgi:fumarylpyruvate hydrolase